MTTELARVESTAIEFALPDNTKVARDLAAIRQFQVLVRQSLMEGHDYGVIPGTGDKPTLLKPGAEKIAKLLGLADTYTVVAHEDWDKPLFHYRVTCRLSMIANGVVVAEGIGECNSMESKYRYRWDRQGDQRVRVLNEDIYSQVNTLLKMAKKRSLVDASLSVGRLSDLFTQDIEEWQPVEGGAPGQSVSQRAQATKPDAAQYYCAEHKTPWFKRGNMRAFAHPIGDTGKWCNMPKDAPKPAPQVVDVSQGEDITEEIFGDDDAPSTPANRPAAPAQAAPASQSTASAVEALRKEISDACAVLGLTTLPMQMGWFQRHCLVPDDRRRWTDAHYQAVAEALRQAVTEQAAQAGQAS